MGCPSPLRTTRASSTLITPEESFPEDIGISSLPLPLIAQEESLAENIADSETDDYELEERTSEQQRIDLRSVTETNSIVLTPPPPCSPATPRRSAPVVRRGRGRPRRVDASEPGEKRGRGRPKKTISVTEEPTAKRGRGRPRK